MEIDLTTVFVYYKLQITRYFHFGVAHYNCSRMADLKTFNGPYKHRWTIHTLHTASVRIMQRHSLRCITSDLFVAISVNYYNATIHKHTYSTCGHNLCMVV